MPHVSKTKTNAALSLYVKNKRNEILFVELPAYHSMATKLLLLQYVLLSLASWNIYYKPLHRCSITLISCGGVGFNSEIKFSKLYVRVKKLQQGYG